VLDTATWRANADWGARLGPGRPRELAAINRFAVDFVRRLAARRPGTTSIVNGVIGPRGDGYVAGEAMSADEATRYHLLQTRAFADAGVDLVTAVTMTYTAEAIGIVEGARAAGLPVAISFTVEIDGHLPSGQRLGDAVTDVDAATDGYASYYLVNCAHPTHFDTELATTDEWIGRLRGVRCNGSRMSHAELDEAETLDAEEPDVFAEQVVALRADNPQLTILGGCCGTDHRHIAAIGRACTS